MSERVGNERPAPRAPGMDRRRRKPDVWSRVLRFVALLVYPVLIMNLCIFLSVAGEKQQQEVVGKMGSVTVQSVSRWVNLHAFLPVMAAGLAVGGGGLILSRKRARRRNDYKFQNQMILTVLSVGGLFIYFLILG